MTHIKAGAATRTVHVPRTDVRSAADENRVQQSGPDPTIFVPSYVASTNLHARESE